MTESKVPGFMIIGEKKSLELFIYTSVIVTFARPAIRRGPI
jgi:hypothetical protein